MRVEVGIGIGEGMGDRLHKQKIVSKSAHVQTRY